MSRTDDIFHDSLGHLVYHASRLMVNRLQKNFASAGLDVTPEQWKVLTVLWQGDGVSQQMVADRLGKDKTSMTRLLQGLERRGLVSRCEARSDRRNKLVRLTEQGTVLQEALIEQARKTLEQSEQGIGAEELARCKAVLSRVVENLS